MDIDRPRLPKLRYMHEGIGMAEGLCPECKSSLEWEWRGWFKWRKKCYSPECDWDSSDEYLTKKMIREL